MNMMKETKRNYSLQVGGTVYTAVAMILTQILLLIHFKTTESAKNSFALPGCPQSCAGIPIPYPFGTGTSCSFSEEFNISCEISLGTGILLPYLGIYQAIEIRNISLSLGQARISSPIATWCYDSTTKGNQLSDLGKDFTGKPMWLNTEKNIFTVIGCHAFGYLLLDYTTNYSVGCLASCDSLDTINKYGSCSGIGCCQTAISKETVGFLISFDTGYTNSEVYNFSPCSYAMVVEEAEFQFNTTYITTDRLKNYTASMPIVIDWVIKNTTCDIALETKSSYACRSDHSICLTISGRGYLCNCSNGYEGNPYLDGGCQGLSILCHIYANIDECKSQNACSKPGKCHNFEGGYRCSCPFGRRRNHNNMRDCDLNVALLVGTAAGIVALLFLGFAIYVLRERRNLSKVKEKYFQQHGGWVLLEKIKLNQGFGFTIFTKQQVEQATNNFDSSNILGQGGQDTVYRGTLRGETVAIKKCKIVNENKKKEFGKEMLILSQVNHKNIVKILGCCLEVEIPMLVYEFITNGTLNHYIHNKNQGSHISLTTRLRIAHESAEALAYLHTSASPPIFHGDVKSANILLDQNYTAKVSDFGASILAPTDEAQFVTFVQGTRGYLDPEYMDSCKLTDRSDVYSFGVVLLELLTRRPVIIIDVSEEAMTLSSCFLSAMEENKMQELLDDEIKHEDDMELIIAVAELAKVCLRMKGEERPTMKEVAEELHRISKLKNHPWGQESNPEETEILLGDRSHHEIEIEHTCYYFNIDKEAEESIAMGR